MKNYKDTETPPLVEAARKQRGIVKAVAEKHGARTQKQIIIALRKEGYALWRIADMMGSEVDQVKVEIALGLRLPEDRRNIR